MLRVAVIGDGHWGKILSNSIGKIQQMKLVGVYTRNYKSLDLDSIDAVVIATPDDTHEEIALYFLENKKDVFLEKPATGSSTRLMSIINAQRDQIVVVDDVFKHTDAFSRLKRSIRTPRLISTDRYNIERRPVDEAPIKTLMYHDLYLVDSLVGSIDSAEIIGLEQDTDMVGITIKIGETVVEMAAAYGFEKTRSMRIENDSEQIYWDQKSGKLSIEKKSDLIEIFEHEEPVVTMLKDFCSNVKNRESNTAQAIRVLKFIERVSSEKL